MGDSARMTVIKGLIDTFLINESYSQAIDLIEKQVCAVGDGVNRAEKCVLLEHLSHCYSADGESKDDDKAFKAICDCMNLHGKRSDCMDLHGKRSDYKFEYAESLYVLGAGLYRNGNLDPACFAFDQALSRNDLSPELRETIQAFIIQIQEDQKADELARRKRGQELIESEEKLKKEIEDKMPANKRKEEGA